MGNLERIALARIAEALIRIADALEDRNLSHIVDSQTPYVDSKGSLLLNHGKRYVFGIKGIQELFNVSHATAQKYKDGILKDAVFQSGRKIVVDVYKAIELFNKSNS